MTKVEEKRERLRRRRMGGHLPKWEKKKKPGLVLIRCAEALYVLCGTIFQRAVIIWLTFSRNFIISFINNDWYVLRGGGGCM